MQMMLELLQVLYVGESCHLAGIVVGFWRGNMLEW